MRSAALLLLLLPCLVAGAEQAVESVTVGMEGRLVVELPADDLAVKDLDPDGDVYLRLAGREPSAGGTTRYDFRYMGMAPGTYDLRDFLERTGGGSVAGLPPLTVTVAGLLPPDDDAILNPVTPAPLPWLSGYRLGMALLVVAWLVAMAAWWRSRPRPPAAEEAVAGPLTPSLADHLQPLLKCAARQELDLEDKARLERLLITYWREKLALGDLPQSEALAVMRRDPEAGRLLFRLEEWLHRPGPEPRVDLDDLLEPYRRAPAPQSPHPALEAAP